MVLRTLGRLSRTFSTGLSGPWCAGLLAFVALNAVFASSPVTRESHAAYTLNVSKFANRTSPQPLAGATVTGKIYVFTGPDTSVDRVRFYLDNPSMSGYPRQIENNAPYDFAGGTVSLANAFDTSKISPGIHTITAALDLTNGQTAVMSAQFEVASTTSTSGGSSSSTTTDSGGYTLNVSTFANRSNPQPLDGGAVTGAIYVFTKPDTSVDRVRFYLDDPTMSKSPRQTENSAPYDFAGGTASLANPFDTSKLSAGVHTITAALDLTNGQKAVVSARFEVASKKLAIGPSPISVAADVGQVATAQANLNSIGGTATVKVSDNAPWLTVTSSSTTTPATLTLSADARQLAQGKYSATVTATADGFTTASAPVSLEVGTEGQFALLVSASANRATPAMLDGATVSGNIYAFVGPETGISRVRFWLDNPSMSGAPRSTENNAPWDFAGGSAGSANPFDTRTLVDGAHSITAAMDLSTGGTATVHTTFVVANSVSGPSPTPTPVPPPPGSGTTVSLQGGRFYINGVVTHPGSRAEGLLMNGRMVNAVFEDEGRSFDAEANTDEFIAAMPDYVAHGMIAFTIGLQGGNPSYEGAINSAFRSDGSLKPTYMARVKRVIQAADSLGAVVILNLFYQRQDQRLASSDAVKAGVVNVMKWLTAEGFGNVMIDIVNEYNWSGFDHSILRTDSGVTSLIKLAQSHAPHLLISASCAFVEPWTGVLSASDYILIHGNAVGDSALAQGIDALKKHGKPIIVNEDPVESTSGRRAILAVQHGASWGLFLRKNQAYSFSFLGAADYREAYQTLWGLTH